MAWAQWGGMAGLAIVYLLAFARHLPYHMDEFLGFHALACAHYPHNDLNTFKSSCSGYDLAPWGEEYRPLRSYDYVGSLPSLLYWPLFRLFPAPWSARLLGPLALAVQALLVHRLFGLRPVLAYALLLSFLPYSIGHTVDFGTLVPQTTSVFAITYWVGRWGAALREGRRSSPVYPILAGLAVFLAIWSKLAYFFVVPGLCLAVGAQLLAARRAEPPPRGKGRRMALEALLGAATAIVPTLLLLAAHTRSGTAYYRVITESRVLPLTEPLALAERFAAHFLPFLLNPLRSANVSVAVPERWSVAGLLLLALAVALLLAGFIGPLARDRAARGRVLGLLAASGLTLLLVTLSERSWASHHVALAAPFVLLAGFETLSRLPRTPWKRSGVAAFLLVSLWLHAQLLRLPPTTRASHQLPAINAELNREFAATHVLVLVDWGLYYVKSLYGPREQAVLHHWRLLRPAQLAEIEAVAARLGRPLAFVGRRRSSSDWELIRSREPALVEHRASVPMDDWIVLYQPLPIRPAPVLSKGYGASSSTACSRCPRAAASSPARSSRAAMARW